jgi:5-formyltetrahydrofolate cyclo-ligase
MHADPTARRKDELRLIGRARRRSLAGGDHAKMDQRICEILTAKVRSLGMGCLAAYVAFDAEPDLSAALLELEQDGLRLALPALEDHGASMRLLGWHSSASMRRNRYGIPEPAAGAEIPLAEVDMILLPLVAYDATGTRLGMGSAYYDRFLHDRARDERPLRVGVAYAAQQLEHIPRQDWDIPMHALVNERGWLSFPMDNGDNEPPQHPEKPGARL